APGARPASPAAPGPARGLGVATRAPDAAKVAAAVAAAQGAFALKDHAAAARHADRALEADPDAVPALVLRSAALGALGRGRESLRDAERALALAPTDRSVRVVLADALLRERRYDDALRHADWLLEREPLSAAGHARRAHALAGLGRRQDALDALKRAGELDPARSGVFARALTLPADEDLLHLFETAAAPAQTASPAAPRGRSPLLSAALAAGGLLLVLAAGLMLMPAGRQTVRRVLSGRPVFADGYELLAETGRDAWGALYEARDRRLGRLVAVRRLAEGADERRRREFLRQAKAVAAGGRKVAEVYAVFDDPEDAWVVFERLERAELSERLRAAAAEDPGAARAARDLLWAASDAA
ncbi:MAG: hypothetical protein SF051_14010, partial [Elusimicrobiota bacterium]|nr:hypothetical protein [Elusimicrobiota bacterium]